MNGINGILSQYKAPSDFHLIAVDDFSLLHTHTHIMFTRLKFNGM